MRNSCPQLNKFVTALNQAVSTAEAADRNLVALSISQSGLNWLATAIAALGWTAEPGELVSIFVGLPIIMLPAAKFSIAAIDNRNGCYKLA